MPHVLPAEVDELVGDRGVVGLPLGLTFVKPTVEPSGIVGSSGRMLSGTPNGSFGAIGRRATMQSSNGFIRTVSFQPSSFGSGGFTTPSQSTRLISCTLKRWKWIGCVSTPLWVIFQIWVPSPVAPIWTWRMVVSSTISVAGSM